MREVVATVTSKGQVTIPAAVREYLGLAKGDRVAFVVGESGRVELRPSPYPTVASLAGAAGVLAETRSWEDMRSIAYEDRRALGR